MQEQGQFIAFLKNSPAPGGFLSRIENAEGTRRSYRMNLSVIIGPQQVSSTGNKIEAPVTPPKVNQEAFVEIADLRLLHALRQRQNEPVPVWKLINEVVSFDQPRSTAERDKLRVWTWSRVKRLLHLGALERVRRRWIRLPTVGEEGQSRAWSTRLSRVGRRASHLRKRTTNKDFVASIPLTMQPENQKRPTAPSTMPIHMFNDVEAEQSAQVPAERISDAARRLRSMTPQRKLRYTGRIGTKRVRVCQRVVLSDGVFGFVVRVLRGRVLVGLEEQPVDGSSSFRLLRANEVRLHKNPAAVMMGREKLGTTERHSTKKVRSSRLNGCRPVRSGSRRRGRPHKSTVIATSTC